MFIEILVVTIQFVDFFFIVVFFFTIQAAVRAESEEEEGLVVVGKLKMSRNEVRVSDEGSPCFADTGELYNGFCR